MKEFKEKRVVVTGGTSGIGLAAARAFVEKGAKVILTGRNKDILDQEANQIGALGLVSDQSNLKDIDQLVDFAKIQLGQIDILFINAGIAGFAPLEAITEESFDQIMDINFKGALFTLQKFLPVLAEGGSVIFLSSINSYNAMATTSVYSASKAALNALARIAAIELAPRRIRVNTISPGPVNTPLWGKQGMPEEQLNQMAGLIQSKVPLRKFGSSEEIAQSVLFLASEASSFTTGAELVVDGGFNLYSMVG